MDGWLALCGNANEMRNSMQAAGKQHLADGSVKYRAMANEAVLKYWKIIDIQTAMRIRRIKWWQQIFNDVAEDPEDHHTSILFTDSLSSRFARLAEPSSLIFRWEEL